MRKTGAYLTVEAAMVMPMVLGVVILVLYLWFYQYDRCLMDQTAGVLAMRGCTLQITDKEQMAEELYSLSQKTDVTRYLSYRPEEAKITLQGNRVTVKQEGALRFPFGGFVPGDAGSSWGYQTAYENSRIKPVTFVRNCRKIMGGK